MYSRDHALVSAVVGLAFVFVVPHTVPTSLLWLYMVVLGVGIDLDHFAIARANRGDWANLRRCIAHPSRAVLDQQSIFEGADVWRDQRLLSHALVGGGLVAATWPLGEVWALATAVTLYAHVVADLYSDVRTRSEYLRRAARSMDE